LPAIDENGPVYEQSLWLQYPADTKLPFKRLVERVNKELNISLHPRHEDFALFALALSVLLSAGRGDMVSRLNAVLDKICEAQVILYYVLAADFPERYLFEIPPFTIGPLRTQKLSYNCEKAKSDFYSRYRRDFANAWTIERAPMAVMASGGPSIQRIKNSRNTAELAKRDRLPC